MNDKEQKSLKEKTKLLGTTVKGFATNVGEKANVVAKKSTETIDKSKECKW